MPSVSLNRKVVEKLAGLTTKKLSDEKLKERIAYMGTDLENLTKEAINVEIFPSRPDMLSEQGFARALSSFVGINTGLKRYTVKKSPYALTVAESAKKARPYTACAIIKGLRYDDEKLKEIIQIQEKLHLTYGRNRKKIAIGIYPFEKINPPIRFISKKPEDIVFQPLEYPKAINGLQILRDHPKGRDYAHLLEGQARFPIFVDADDKILSMPPIINSDDVGKISNDTTDVFIETSGFDYAVCAKCLNIIVTALADMGGDIYSMELDLYGKKITSPDLSFQDMQLDIDYVNKRLGLVLKESDIKTCLERMGHGYTRGGKVQVPSYRADVLHPIDLVEDIAIAYGYEHIDGIIPKVATVGEETKSSRLNGRLTEILTGVGLVECKVYHITNKEHQTALMEYTPELIELSNAISNEYNTLSAWNIPSLMEVLRNNKHHEYPQNIFTIGTIFHKGDTNETGVDEESTLACLLCADSADYTRIRQLLDYTLRMIGTDYKIRPAKHPSFIPGRCGSVVVNGTVVAYLGEISAQVLDNWELSVPASAFELNIDKLMDAIDY